MPTLFVTLHVVATFVIQLTVPDRTIFQINGTAQPLHAGEELVMQVLIFCCVRKVVSVTRLGRCE